MPRVRVAIGGIFHESNTFCRSRTTLAEYERARLYTGAEMLGPMRGTDTELGGFLEGADALGWQVVPTFYAWAWPGGPLTDDCFQLLVERFRNALQAALPVDGLLLSLHGAMATETEEDPDGLLLAEARAALPPGVPLVATFDLHANLSPLMVRRADMLLGYETYPHVDLRERGLEAVEWLRPMLEGEVQPVMALAKPPLVPHLVKQRTADGPMAELLSLARAAEEAPGLLRVSIAAGFPYADVPRMGMGILAVADGDPDLAAETAATLAEAAWERREAFTAELPDPETAVRRALAAGHASGGAAAGPVVLADFADNVGGGAPGDGTVLLRELLRQGAREAVVLLADPEAVAHCLRAGVRSTVRLTVGGKTDDRHGEPVPLEGYVRALTDGRFRNVGPMRDGLVDDMGRTAVVETAGVLLVLTERRMPTWNLEQLRSVGIEPSRQRIVVCKGAVAHRAAFAGVAAEMIDVDTPGCCPGDIRRLEYRNVRRPLFPLDRW